MSRKALTWAGVHSSHRITGISAIPSLRSFQPEVSVDDLAIAANKTRNLEPELTDGIAHTVYGRNLSIGQIST